MSRFEFTDPDCPITTVVEFRPLDRVCVHCGAAGIAWIVIDNCFGDLSLSGYVATWCKACHRGAA